MKLLGQLWTDECGIVLSAEMVLIGTLGVAAATVGLHTAATAVNEELVDFGYAIRSLDQSYATTGHRSCGAWTAGSSYQQQDVEISLKELCALRMEEAGETPDPQKLIERINEKKQTPSKKNADRKLQKKPQEKSGEEAAEADAESEPAFPYRPST